MRLRHRLPLAVGLMLSATPALAHPGHGGASFAAGLLHPLSGVDHLAAMLLVGLWAGLLGGRAFWALPIGFLGAMLAGFGYAAIVHGAVGTEGFVVLSVLALGAVVGWKLRLPPALATATVALFGFAHGMAHGMEAPAGEVGFDFAGGFLLVTLLLHIAGLRIAASLPVAWTRAIGVGAVGLGLLLVGAA